MYIYLTTSFITTYHCHYSKYSCISLGWSSCMEFSTATKDIYWKISSYHRQYGKPWIMDLVWIMPMPSFAHFWRPLTQTLSSSVIPFFQILIVVSIADPSMADSIMTMNNDDPTDHSDEIVNDMISLIHSNTHSSYVTCSQLSSKLISVLSQLRVHDNQWKDLEKAVKVIVFPVTKLIASSFIF